MPSRTHHRRRAPRRTIESRRVALAAVVAVAGWLGCRSAPLPVLGTVPAFSLTERSGRPLTSADLAGRVWIADFVFTHCPDFCPALTTRMGELARTLPAGNDPILLVSFTVDPVHDTPDVLRSYASKAAAGDRWSFVTGERDVVAGLLRDGFKVAWADDGPPTAPITHSDRFVLVDRGLRIRGYYHGTEPDDVKRLARDAVRLQDEPRA